jgi:hypothetical protein
MGYQNQVLEDVQLVRHRLCGDWTEPRVLVFTYDLDLCPTGMIMEILQAISLILGESDFYVFLGIGTEMEGYSREASIRLSLEYAPRNASSENPVTDLVDPDSEAGKFASQITEDDVLAVDDLALHGPLARAASISHLIVWKSATSHGQR